MSLHGDFLESFKIVGKNLCVPASCCIKEKLGNSVLCQERGPDECGEKDRNGNKINNNEPKRNEWKMDQVNIRTCPAVIQELYDRLVPGLLTFVGILAGFNIIVEIVTIALASAFVAQITRRAKRYEMGDGMEMD